MSRLLRLLRGHADAVEAALLPSVDLRDHYRYQPGDPGYLSLRRMAVIIRWLPPGNPIDRVEKGRYWTPEMQLDDDRRRDARAIAGEKHPKPHPMSPYQDKARPVSPERMKKFQRGRARARRRRQRLGQDD